MFIGTPSKPITLEPRNLNISTERTYGSRILDVILSSISGREWELAGYYFEKANSNGRID